MKRQPRNVKGNSQALGLFPKENLQKTIDFIVGSVDGFSNKKCSECGYPMVKPKQGHPFCAHFGCPQRYGVIEIAEFQMWGEKVKPIQCPKCKSHKIHLVLKHILIYEVEGIDENGELRWGDLIEEIEGEEDEFQCADCRRTWKVPGELLAPSSEE
jgi:ssDNA-binding Zn-finger/Zn-ribbon topoisomerase 1